jgi:hypothetical protein
VQGEPRHLDQVGDRECLVGPRRRCSGSPSRRSNRVSRGAPAAGSRRRRPASVDGYRAAGRVLGGLGLPTVVVQEGGYDLAAIGRLVGETLAGIEEGRA